MKEQVLLMAIASVGFSGLFTIYNDVKSYEKATCPRYRLAKQEVILQQKTRSETYAPMHITPIASQHGVQIDVNNFTDHDLFSIDFGNGFHSILEKSECTFHYTQPGTYKVQLFKNDELIHARQLQINAPDVTELAIHL